MIAAGSLAAPRQRGTRIGAVEFKASKCTAAFFPMVFAMGSSSVRRCVHTQRPSTSTTCDPRHQSARASSPAALVDVGVLSQHRRLRCCRPGSTGCRIKLNSGCLLLRIFSTRSISGESVHWMFPDLRTAKVMCSPRYRSARRGGIAIDFGCFLEGTCCGPRGSCEVSGPKFNAISTIWYC